MKKTNKKGFTIVELVIVIAVIAILAGVMIPTFGNIIENANKNAVLQGATSAYKSLHAIDLLDGTIEGSADPEVATEITKLTTANTDLAITYTAASGVVTAFTYKDGDITASYNTTKGIIETP